MSSDSLSKPIAWNVKLRRLVNIAFSSDNLHDLTMDLGIDFDDIPGSTKTRKITELMQILARDKRIPEFIETCEALRPRENWRPLLEEAKKNPLSFDLDYETIDPEMAVYKFIGKAVAEALEKRQDTHFNDQISQNAQSLSSEQAGVNVNALNRKSMAWDKSKKIPSHISYLNKGGTKSESEASKTPQHGRLQEDMDGLEAHIAEEIDNFLEGVRNKIEELKLKLDEQPMMPSETWKAARPSMGFQGKPKASFQVNKSPFAPQQPETRSNRGFGERQFP